MLHAINQKTVFILEHCMWKIFNLKVSSIYFIFLYNFWTCWILLVYFKPKRILWWNKFGKHSPESLAGTVPVFIIANIFHAVPEFLLSVVTFMSMFGFMFCSWSCPHRQPAVPVWIFFPCQWFKESGCQRWQYSLSIPSKFNYYLICLSRH